MSLRWKHQASCVSPAVRCGTSILRRWLLVFCFMRRKSTSLTVRHSMQNSQVALTWSSLPCALSRRRCSTPRHRMFRRGASTCCWCSSMPRVFTSFNVHTGRARNERRHSGLHPGVDACVVSRSQGSLHACSAECNICYWSIYSRRYRSLLNLTVAFSLWPAHGRHDHLIICLVCV